MMTFWLCLLSLACLLLMAWLDPKRRRVQRLPKIRQRPWLRRSISGLCLLPGLVMIFLGAWPSFLIWLGVSTLSGWLVAWGFAEIHPSIKKTNFFNANQSHLR